MKTNILLACDKFKHSMTSHEANAYLSSALVQNPNITCNEIALADGGEGSLDVICRHLGLDLRSVEVTNAIGQPIHATYAYKDSQAYIESAAAIGLQHINESDRNPMHTTSYGLGQLILDAIRNGAEAVHIFLGGSATNDAGIGMAKALGYSFRDGQGKEVNPIGKNLPLIEQIGEENLLFSRSKITFFTYSDVDAVFYGPQGASHLFAAQKGANDVEIEKLDEGLRHLHALLFEIFGFDGRKLAGSGAAGSLGGGCVVFLGSQLKSGISFLMEITHMEEKIKAADFVITGEGNLDDQSANGKLVSGIASLCKKFDKPLILVCGQMNISRTALSKLAPWKCYTIMDDQMSKEDAIAKAPARMREIGKQIAKDILEI